MTWEGHEFADAARNDTVWGKTKTYIKDKGMTATFGALLEVLKYQAKQHLGLP